MVAADIDTSEATKHHFARISDESTRWISSEGPLDYMFEILCRATDIDPCPETTETKVAQVI
jgi:hypothetical protein